MTHRTKYGVVSLLLMAFVLPDAALAASGLDNRVAQLERISDAHGQLLTQLQQQLADTQRDLDSLRGRIQENQHQLRQLTDRQQQLLTQIDGLVKAQTQPAPTPAPAAPAVSPKADKAEQPAASPKSDKTGKAETPTAQTDATAPAVQSEEANRDYNRAVALVLKKKQHAQAMAAFQAFIKKYPQSTYQPNAWYWLGQLNYSQGKKEDALYYFAHVARTWPKSPKSPAALFKVGMIMEGKQQKAEAKLIYQQILSRYPDSQAAGRAKAQLARLS